MRTQIRSGGFTVIEVMLFLAVTGALTVALLVGSGIAINQQRYRDSVNSFKGFIQEQYGQVTNIINSEAENPVCSPSGTAVLFDEDGRQARGTSECLVLGRFLYIEPTKTTAYNVIGQPSTSTLGDGDTLAFQEFALAAIDPVIQENAWGATISDPETSGDLTAAVLILRSPLSGSILTYIEDDSGVLASIIDKEAGNHTPIAMITDANMVQKDFCISSGGLSPLASRLAVRINARASNQSAIEIPLETENVCK